MIKINNVLNILNDKIHDDTHRIHMRVIEVRKKGKGYEYEFTVEYGIPNEIYNITIFAASNRIMCDELRYVMDLDIDKIRTVPDTLRYFLHLIRDAKSFSQKVR